ncbi:unnamed protein product [Orchesella dallaii]|uniref:Uncharacterized protein n=1 Tax=Orchesella dallaii TaxID=48710 RepID=A0ABP1QYJ0_9HEXA
MYFRFFLRIFGIPQSLRAAPSGATGFVLNKLGTVNENYFQFNLLPSPRFLILSDSQREIV